MDWERRWQEGDVHWDHGEAAPPLREYLNGANGRMQGPVLVPGCGSGHDVALLAEHGLPATGMDIAPTAIATARRLYGSMPQAWFVEGDFLRLGPGHIQAYQTVFEHTCFCALDPDCRESYVEACAQALEPGGQLLAIFYLNPAAENGPPFGVERAEIDRLFEPRFELKETSRPTRQYESRIGREELRLYRKR